MRRGERGRGGEEERGRGGEGERERGGEGRNLSSATPSPLFFLLSFFLTLYILVPLPLFQRVQIIESE